jgi:lipopolysaccharide assembly outer membrane protein LptD (OstA)
MKFLLKVLLFAVLAGAAYWAVVSYQPAKYTSSKIPEGGDPNGQIIEHFTLEGFDDGGDESWKLQGDSAHVSSATDVFIEKNVVLTMLGGAVIHSDKVFWQNNKTRFTTTQPVMVSHRNIQVKGRGAIGKLNQKSIQINQDIRMLIEPDGTWVTCRGPMRILQIENRVTLYHDVRIADDRGDLVADRMDAYFDPDTKKIILITAAGNVRITRGEDVSVADKAIYDTRTGSIRLEGLPEISIRDTNRIEPAKIPFKTL